MLRRVMTRLPFDVQGALSHWSGLFCAAASRKSRRQCHNPAPHGRRSACFFGHIAYRSRPWLTPLGIRTRTLRIPEKRRTARFQALGLPRSQRRSSTGHCSGQHDEAGRALRPQIGRRAAHAVLAHPVQLHVGLVSPAKDAKCPVLQHGGL